MFGRRQTVAHAADDHQHADDRSGVDRLTGFLLGVPEVTPENPVLLGHASGHAAFVNELAMELAGITAATW